MKIEIDVEDISLFAKALNNAIISYGDVVWGIHLGCEVPSKLNPLKKVPDEELMARVEYLKGVYNQVEKLERINNDI